MTIKLSVLPAAILAGLVAVHAPTAHASPCGGSDSGSDSDSGSSDSSSYDDDDDWDSDSGDSTPACVNTSDIVGRAECTRFGQWDASWRPPLQVSLGASTRRLGMTGRSFNGAANHEQKIGYQVDSADMGDGAGVQAISFDIRLTGTIARYFYVGVEGSIGGGGLSGDSVHRRGDLTVTTDNATVGSLGVVAGLQVPITDRMSLGAEAVAGGRWVSLGVTTRHFDCVDESSVTDGSLSLSPRVVATRWLSPYFSASATLGSDSMSGAGASVGFLLTAHTRGFDGARGR